jgi:hypothetical protein
MKRRMANGKITSTETAQEFRQYRNFCKKPLVEKEGEGTASKREASYFRVVKHFTCYFGEEGGITFAFLHTLFPNIARRLCGFA